MSNYPPEAFEELAIDRDEALASAERFLALRQTDGLAVQLYSDPDESGIHLLSKQQVLEATDHHLERGGRIRLVGGR